jgi:hypothetical protein
MIMTACAHRSWHGITMRDSGIFVHNDPNDRLPQLLVGATSPISGGGSACLRATVRHPPQ